jgi:hypothetical protein
MPDGMAINRAVARGGVDLGNLIRHAQVMRQQSRNCKEEVEIDR